MNRTTFERLERPEAAKILSWRFDRLVDAGYEPDTASFIAGRVEIDLHEAVGLVLKGCPPATAVRILV
jgi:hypothetical protein